MYLLLCTSSWPYVLFSVLPFSHQAGSCWTPFFKCPLTSGITDWFRLEGIVAYHTVLTLLLLKLIQTMLLGALSSRILKVSIRGDSVAYLFQCFSNLESVSSSVYSASLWSLSFKSHQHHEHQAVASCSLSWKNGSKDSFKICSWCDQTFIQLFSLHCL